MWLSRDRTKETRSKNSERVSVTGCVTAHPDFSRTVPERTDGTDGIVQASFPDRAEDGTPVRGGLLSFGGPASCRLDTEDALRWGGRALIGMTVHSLSRGS